MFLMDDIHWMLGVVIFILVCLIVILFVFLFTP